MKPRPLKPKQTYFSFLSTVRRLRDTLSSSKPVLPSWVYVVPASIPGILHSLDYWLANTSMKTVSGMLAHHDPDKHDEDVMQTLGNLDESSPYKLLFCSPAEREAMVERAGLEQVVEWMTLLSGGNRPPVPQDATRKATFMKMAKSWLLKTVSERQSDLKANGAKHSAFLQPEKDFYKKSRAFLPPSALRKRHGALAELWDTVRKRSGSKAQASLIDSLVLKVLVSHSVRFLCSMTELSGRLTWRFATLGKQTHPSLYARLSLD